MHEPKGSFRDAHLSQLIARACAAAPEGPRVENEVLSAGA